MYVWSAEIDPLLKVACAVPDVCVVVKHTSMLPPTLFEPLDDDDMDYVEAVTKHYDCEHHQPISDQPRRSLVRHAARASVAALAAAGAVAAAALAAGSVR